MGLAIEWSKVEIKLRVRDTDANLSLLRALRIALRAAPANWRLKREPKQYFPQKWVGYSKLYYFLFRSSEDPKVAVKNYAVHQSLEDPGSASQQSECNDPAPH